jgi:hypothetical protein
VTRARLVALGVVATLAAALAMASPAAAASLTVSPHSVASGQTIAITGSGYQNNDFVTLSDDGVVFTTNVLTDNSGSFTTSYTMPPNSTVKRHTIVATDRFGARAQDFVDVTAGGGGGAPTLTVNPQTAASGATIVLNGSGFADAETVSIIIDNGQEIARPTTNGGMFSTSAVVPGSVGAGPHTLTARGITSNFLAYAQLVVDGSSLPGNGCGPGGACFYNTTPTASAGQQLAFYGRGYQPGEGIVVVADTGPTVGTTTADGSGNFSSTGTVPRGLAPGQHRLTARGTASGREASSTVNVVDSYGQGANYAAPPNSYGAPPGAGAPYPPGAYPQGYGSYPGGPYAGGPPQAVRPYGSGYGSLPPAGAAAPVSTHRIPFTGAKVRGLAFIAVSLLLGGMLLLSARAVLKPARPVATGRIFQRPTH